MYPCIQLSSLDKTHKHTYMSIYKRAHLYSLNDAQSCDSTQKPLYNLRQYVHFHLTRDDCQTIKHSCAWTPGILNDHFQQIKTATTPFEFLFATAELVR